MPTSIEHRVNDIIDRYSPSDIVYAHITKHLPGFVNLRKRITNLLRDVTNQLPWIFIDVDGTLVEPGKATPEKNVHSVREYVHKGGRVSLVTGKLESSIAPLIDEMGLGRIPHIVLNGAIIVNSDAAGESPILSKLGEVSEQISRLLDRENVEHYFYGENEIIFAESFQSEEGLDYLRSLGEPVPVQRARMCRSFVLPPCYLSSLALNKTRVPPSAHCWNGGISVQGIPSVSEILRMICRFLIQWDNLISLPMPATHWGNLDSQRSRLQMPAL